MQIAGTDAEEDPGVDCGIGEARLCESRRQGSHRNFTHPRVTRPVTISGDVGDDAKKYQEKAVQAAIAEATE